MRQRKANALGVGTMEGTKATVVIAVVLSVLGSCVSSNGESSGGSSTEVASAFEEAECPPPFVEPDGGSVSCGYLTVPEDRSDPDGATIRLFFSRWTPAGELSPDPVLDMDSLVMTFGEGTQGAINIHRETIVLDERGTGRSEPALTCPEIDELAPMSLSASSDDETWRAGDLDGVTRCHDRLAAEGIDLSAYNLQEMAGDAEDLRVALGFDQWNLRGLGSGARLAFEIIRRYPDRVRAAWLDTPEIPQVDTLSGAIIGTRYGLQQVAKACSADERCDGLFPHVLRTAARNLLRFARRSVHLSGISFQGDDIPILLDDGLALRAFREILTWNPQLGPLTTAGLASDWHAYGSHDWIADDSPFLFGFVPGDDPHYTFAHGAYLSGLCHDQLAFTTRADLLALADGDPAYEQAFARAPFLDACEVWDVGAAAREVHEPVVSDVPILLFVGRFGPYAPRPLVDEAAETLSNGWVLEFPNKGHNVLWDECARDVRSAWLDDPTAPPDTNCMDDLDPIWFESSV